MAGSNGNGREKISLTALECKAVLHECEVIHKARCEVMPSGRLKWKTFERPRTLAELGIKRQGRVTAKTIARREFYRAIGKIVLFVEAKPTAWFAYPH
jgi:hypothetical protein